MIILVNAERLEVDAKPTVAALLQSLGYPDRGIAVALDQAVLPRSSWATTLSAGAQIEVVTAVQGGCHETDDRRAKLHVAVDHGHRRRGQSGRARGSPDRFRHRA